MRYTTLELSDACAVLGSGQEDAIADMDDTEYQGTKAFDALTKRMGG